MKRPMVILALLYTAGVLLGDLFPLPLTALLAGCFLLASAGLVVSRWRKPVLGLLLVLLGATNLNLHTAIVSPHDVRRLVEERNEEVALRGTLCQAPAVRISEQGGEILWRTVAELEAQALRFQTNGADWQAAFGRVAVSTPGALAPAFFAGQKVQVTGRLRPPKEALANGLFDYRNHLRRQGIYYQLQVTSTNGWQVQAAAQPSRPPLTERFITWGKGVLARGLPAEDESLRLEWALTLGWKTALTEEVSEPFIRAATYHIFAVDGLRIVIISGIFLSLLRVLGLTRAVAGIIVIPLLWFYAALTGYPASAIRATVMATVVIGGWALKRPSDFVNSLFAAALIILLWEPGQLFQAGFQLSFFVVLCIVLLMPALNEYVEHLIKPDPWLPGSLRPRWQQFLLGLPLPQESDAAEQFWRWPWERFLRRIWVYVRETFLVSLVAWLGSIPLTACYFHVLTPVSAPANLLAVPLCSLVLICNLLSLLLAPWFPLGTEFYNHAGWFLMECIRASSRWFEHWPAAYFYVPAPGLFATGLYYLLLLTIATGWIFKIRRRAWALSGLALLTAAWCWQWALDYPTIRMTILPLKGASALLIDGPGRANDLLINCGNESSAGFITKPFLRAQGVNGLPRLLLTHGDINYIGGAELIRQGFAPSCVNLSPVRFRSPAYRELLRNFQSSPGLVNVIRRGDRVGSWRVLHPEATNHFPRAEDNAVVLRGALRGIPVLLLSSLGRAGQNVLCTRQADLRSEIVVAGLPKQGEPLADGLLDAIQPRLIVITDSEYPAAARANRSLRERLARRGVPVVYTSEVGAITLRFRRHGWDIGTMKPAPKSGGPPAERDITEAGSE